MPKAYDLSEHNNLLKSFKTNKPVMTILFKNTTTMIILVGYPPTHHVITEVNEINKTGNDTNGLKLLQSVMRDH